MVFPDDIDKLRLDAPIAPSSQKASKRRPRTRHGEQFIAGPIPLPWITAAAALPGKAMQTAMAIWFLAGVRRSSCVTLTTCLVKKFSVLPDAKRRALKALEKAGLIQVDRGRGRNPIVTIQTLEQEATEAD